MENCPKLEKGSGEET